MFTTNRTAMFVALICTCAAFALVPSGALANGTTAYSCSKEKGAKDFSDAHCVKAVTAGTGNFGHAVIGEPETITVTNERTASETTAASPIGLFGTFGGTKLEVTCNVAKGSGTLSNGESAGTMQTTGSLEIEFSACTTQAPTTCSTEPVTYKTHYKTFQSESKMGVEFTPESGSTFGTFVVKDNGGKHCGISGSYKIEGSFEGTPGSSPLGGGGTLGFSEEMCNLKWSGIKYTLFGAVTLQSKAGDAIAFTT